MASKTSIRVSEIPYTASKTVLENRINDILSKYKPFWDFRRWSFGRLGDSPSLGFRLSLCAVHNEQVATISFKSAEIKAHVLKNRSEFSGWNFDDDFSGITVLHAPVDHSVDICMIHGLGGHGLDTWTSGGIVWPRDLLPKSDQFENCRISTFGYNAQLRDRGSRSNVRQWAQDFLNQMCHLRSRNNEHKRPLILICHSLGGLLGREAMIRLGSFGKETPQVSLGQCGLLFLATPHSGSSEADWSRTLMAICELAFGVRSKDIVDRLRTFNDPSVASKEAFAALRPQPPFFCLSEGRATKVLGSYRQVVSQDSAGLNRITAVPLPDCDHREVAKFERNTGAFLVVSQKLHSLCDRLLQSPANDHTSINTLQARSAVDNDLYGFNATQDTHREEAQSGASPIHIGSIIASGQSNVNTFGIVHATDFSTGHNT